MIPPPKGGSRGNEQLWDALTGGGLFDGDRVAATGPRNINRYYYRFGRVPADAFREQFRLLQRPIMGGPQRTHLARDAKRPQIDELI